MNKKINTNNNIITGIEEKLSQRGFPSYDEFQDKSISIDISNMKPMTLDDLGKILDITIKEDRNNKVAIILAMILTYTYDSQINILLNAPSSTGKSYIPTEIVKLFPEEDVRIIGYCTPTAFFHDYGVWDSKKKTMTVDLESKIILFLDQPHNMLLERLRPLLSHDKKEIPIKITDKTDKGGLRTKNIILRGFPSVVFCTVGLKVDEQESTRNLMLSPEQDQVKIKNAIHDGIIKSINSSSYNEKVETDNDRNLLKERMLAIKEANIKDIRIEDGSLVEDLFLKGKDILKPRYQRDITKFISLIKACTLLNFPFRKRVGDILIANKDDISEGYNLWENISKNLEYNLSPYVYNFYKDVVVPLFQEKNKNDDMPQIGLLKKEILKKSQAIYGRSTDDWQFRHDIIPALENGGLITEEPDIDNRTRIMYYPQTLNNESQDNSVQEVGVDDIKEIFKIETS